MVITAGTIVNSGQESVSHSQQMSHAKKSTDSAAPHQQDNHVSHNQAINEMNGHLKPETEIVYDYDKVSQRIWLNVIDKASGKVITELPPEVIRKIEDGYAGHIGIIFDKKL